MDSALGVDVETEAMWMVDTLPGISADCVAQRKPAPGGCGWDSALGGHDAERGAGVARAEQREDALPQGAGRLESEEQVQRAAVVEGHAAPFPVQVHTDAARRGPGAAQRGGLGSRECPEAASTALHGPHGPRGAQPHAALAAHRLPGRTHGVAALAVVLGLPRGVWARGGRGGLHLPAVPAGTETLCAQHRRELIEARGAVGGRGCPWRGQSDAAAVRRDKQAAVRGARVQGQVGCTGTGRRGALEGFPGQRRDETDGVQQRAPKRPRRSSEGGAVLSAGRPREGRAWQHSACPAGPLL